MKVLITGGTGLVGSQLVADLSDAYDVLSPVRQELDITDKVNVSQYISSALPGAIIHAAAFTDNDEAEKDRNNEEGLCYRVNVTGTQNICDTAKEHRIPVVHISTGSVFSGDDMNPGPFDEHAVPAGFRHVSWYAATKRMGELSVLAIGSTVVRISHPVSKDPRSYIHRLSAAVAASGMPLHTDQRFPITKLTALGGVISRILSNGKKGIYHAASTDFVSPYELALYLVRRGLLPEGSVHGQQYSAFIQSRDLPLRYSQYHAIDSRGTNSRLGVLPYGWQDAINDALGLG